MHHKGANGNAAVAARRYIHYLEDPYTDMLGLTAADADKLYCRSMLHAGRSTGGLQTLRGPLHGGVADLFYNDVRSILMVLRYISKVLLETLLAAASEPPITRAEAYVTLVLSVIPLLGRDLANRSDETEEALSKIMTTIEGR